MMYLSGLSPFPEHEKITAVSTVLRVLVSNIVFCLQHYWWAQNLPFLPLPFSTRADGFPSEEEYPSFPRTPSYYEAQRGRGSWLFMTKKWTRDRRWHLYPTLFLWNIAEHSWAHQGDNSGLIRGTVPYHPLMGRQLYYNLNYSSSQRDGL